MSVRGTMNPLFRGKVNRFRICRLPIVTLNIGKNYPLKQRQAGIKLQAGKYLMNRNALYFSAEYAQTNASDWFIITC